MAVASNYAPKGSSAFFLATVFLVLAVSISIQTVQAVSPCGTAASYPEPASTGGLCATYDSSLPDGSLAFCNGIVDYSYFHPTGTNQSFLDKTAENLLLGGNPDNAILLGLLPDRCTLQLKRVVCLSVYQACELVDPFFVDSTCGLGACTTCGEATDVNGTNLFSPETLNPVYGSTCGAGPALCSVGPGKVPGMGNIGWELAKAAKSPGDTMPEFCADFGLTWSESAKSCLAAVPRSPCKSECNKLWSMDSTVGFVNGGPGFVNSVCPLISGNFGGLLTQLQSSSDQYVADQATNALGNATHGNSTISLLAALNLAPSCNGNITVRPIHAFSEVFTQEVFLNRAQSLGSLIKTKADAVASNCHCIADLAKLNLPTSLIAEDNNVYCDPTRTGDSVSAYCTTLSTQTSRCFKNGGNLAPNSAVRFAGLPGHAEGMHPICKQVVTHPNNQPSEDVFTFLQTARGIPREYAVGAFFVAPAPGLPALAGGDMTARPLCEIPNGLGTGEVFRGYNSYECGVASVSAAANVIPPVLSGRCRLKFLDMLCNQIHMKLEFKEMCLLPNNARCEPDFAKAAATNTLGFPFALPRFASRQMCLDFKSECDGFLNSLGPARATLEATFNCTGVVSQTCAGNNRLDNWSSNTWACASGLNGIPSYPTATQQLTDLSSSPLATYAVANNLDLAAFAGLTKSSVAVASVSSAANGLDNVATCECPEPFVVPDDPTHTANPSTCCQQRCTGYMFTDEAFDSFITVQKVVSCISLAGTVFIVATWGCFKIKRAQFLTLLIGFASLNVCFVFIIPTFSKPDIREVFCKDNTRPNTQDEGGMCLFQSIWLAYWTLCTCCFWLLMSFDLFMRVVRGERHLERFTKFYHLFGWGYPLVVVIVHLSLDAYGYQQMQFWCFLRDMPENPSLNVGLDLGLFYGSVVTIWTVGLIFMFLVMYQIFKITSKAASTAQTSNKIAKRIALYRTPVFFVFFFSYVWVSIFGWRFDLEVKKPLIEEAGLAWGSCLLVNFGKGIPDPATNPLADSSELEKYGVPPNTGCGELLPVRLEYSSIMYLMFIAGLQGFFIFVIFGAKMENINLWKEKLHLTTKKYDTTAEDSSTKENKSGGKPSILSQAMSSIFSPGPPKANDSVEKDGGSAVMVNGLQSGKFIAVTDVNLSSQGSPPVKANQVAAAYMAE